jgi:MFS family permease
MNVKILFITRSIRLFAYGLLSVILSLFLSEIGFADTDIGLLLSLTLFGDLVISFFVSIIADSFGRKRILIISSFLMLLSSIVFAFSNNFTILLISAIIGVISPSGNEIGPFSTLEQSALAQLTTSGERTKIFAWYQLIGYFSTGIGSLVSGWICSILVNYHDWNKIDAYRTMIIIYGVLAISLVILFSLTSKQIELQNDEQQPLLETNRNKPRFSSESKLVVLKLSILCGIDSLGGGLISGTLLAYWFHLKFGVESDYLGTLLFVANIIAGTSSLLAVWISKRIGLINTMVFTHLPSNILTILIVCMPTLMTATVMLFLRFSMSQMDVAPRQSFIMSVVKNSERSTTMGIINVSKTFGSSIAPFISGYLAGNNSFDMAFWLCGGLKIVYDLGILWGMKQHRT